MAGTIYNTVNRELGKILSDIYEGRLGLPDLQRPFIWPNSKARDLLDSMLKGFPIGYFMSWERPDDYNDVKQIGDNKKNYIEPKSVIIDGQQRLTVLLSVMFDVPVYDEDYNKRKIQIAYDPIERRFEVCTPALEKSPRFIPNITEVFLKAKNQQIPYFRREYIRKLNGHLSGRGLPVLTDEEECRAEEGISDLVSLLDMNLPTIEIQHTVSSKDVADIFVRINSAGEKLSQNDFILTLISVYDLPMKARIDQFCADCTVPAKNTSFNHMIQVKPSHIVKVVTGIAFKRGRLKYAYRKMAGVLQESGEEGMTPDELRESNFSKFSEGLDKVLNLNNWHGFLNCISGAGYVDRTFVAAENSIVYCYLLYLIGKYEFRVSMAELNVLIRRWFFVSSITTFYSNSTETTVEGQLNDIKRPKSATDFIDYLNGRMDLAFTDDYFTYTLLDQFNSSSSNSPYWYGFVASLVVLDTRAMFSTQSLQNMLFNGASGSKCNYDKHHLFPKEYLASLGIVDDRLRNQFANFTYIDYTTNIEISDRPPSDYVTSKRGQMGEEDYHRMCDSHALPYDWEQMEYDEFLAERKKLMTRVVKRAYDKLGSLQS